MKYTRKINKNFNFISQPNYTAEVKTGAGLIKSECALLQGACCHYFTGEKALNLINERKNKLISLLNEPFDCEEQELINLYGNILFSLCAHFQIVKNDSDFDIIDQIANFLTTCILNKTEEFTFNKNPLFAKVLSVCNGLSEYYSITKSDAVKKAISYLSQNLKNLNFENSQNTCYDYLSLCQGVSNFAYYSKESAVNEYIAPLFDNFCANAQSLNYESAISFTNKNITSPSATAKSLEVALTLFNNTQDQRYLTMARRIWFNGMQFCQRENGQVGFNLFTNGKNTLKVFSYEEKQIQTPLYASGLKCYATAKNLFEESGSLTKDRRGRYLIGDKMFVRDISGFFGNDLIEIPTLTAFDKETALQLEFKLTF